MRTRRSSTWGALVVLLAVGCGGTEPAGLPSEPTVAGVEVLRPGAARLPTTTGAPQPLRAGRYRAPEGFAPALTVTVPAGWWGGGTAAGWTVGQGYDATARRFGGGIFVQVLDLSYDEAVRAFRGVEGLAGSRVPRVHRVDGHRAATFRTRAASTPVLLRAALGVDVDVRAEGWSQTFVALPGGRTLFVRTEVTDRSAVPVVVRVLGSLSWP